MKILFLCAVIFGFVSAGKVDPEKDHYSSRYDHIELIKALQNKRMLDRYMDCLLIEDSDKCDKDGTYLKEKLPEAIQTDCIKCTTKQKIGAFKAIDYLITHKKGYWNRIQEKYDPSNGFIKRNAAQLEYIRSHETNFVQKDFLALFVKGKHHNY